MRFRATYYALALAGLIAASGTAQAEALRPAIGKPLATAKSFYEQHNYAKAMAAVKAADAVPGKTASEQLVIEQMRAAIANASGDNATAVHAYTFLLASGAIAEGEKINLIQALAGIEYRQKNYAAAASWAAKYFAAGGRSNDVLTLQIQSYYLGGQYAEAARVQASQINAEIRGGRAPSEDHLQLLYSCQKHVNDAAGAFATIRQLVTYYPKPDYWANVISAVASKPTFNDRLQFDLLRFEFAIGLVNTPKDAMELAELALQDKLGGEAKEIVDLSYKGGLLGTGPEAPREQRLRDLITRSIATEQAGMGTDDADAATDHDGNRLEALGEQYVSFANFAKGIPMIQAAIRKDDLRHAEDAKLHLAIALLKSGDKRGAAAEFRAVKGTDGTADLASLWLLHIGK
jgi:hypothetical protein